MYFCTNCKSEEANSHRPVVLLLLVRRTRAGGSCWNGSTFLSFFASNRTASLFSLSAPKQELFCSDLTVVGGLSLPRFFLACCSFAFDSASSFSFRSEFRRSRAVFRSLSRQPFIVRFSTVLYLLSFTFLFGIRFESTTGLNPLFSYFLTGSPA